jgi:uncharacterized repeat protein (TIGR01451 family)
MSLTAGFLLVGGLVLNAQEQAQNRVIRNRHSSFYDNPLSETYTGKSPFNRPHRQPAAVPAPPPKVFKPTSPKVSVAESCPSLVNLVKKAPAAVTVGEPFTYELTLAAQCDVAEVVVVDTLPVGMSFVQSQPAASQEGGRLTWRFATMNRGDVKVIKVSVKAEREGELVSSATITAIPRVNVSTTARKAGAKDIPRPEKK